MTMTVITVHFRNWNGDNLNHTVSTTRYYASPDDIAKDMNNAHPDHYINIGGIVCLRSDIEYIVCDEVSLEELKAAAEKNDTEVQHGSDKT